MKLKYLGTAAAEGYPAMFCNCENCKKAQKEKGDLYEQPKIQSGKEYFT